MGIFMGKKLNIGCGNDYREEYVNLDNKGSRYACDVRHDLNVFPYPFKESTFEEVYCSNILEHLNDVPRTLQELRRITKNQGIIRIIVPHFSSADVWGDLSHKRGFSAQSFSTDMAAYQGLDGFKLLRQNIQFPGYRFYMRWFANLFKGFYENNLAYLFPASTLCVDLEVVK